MDKIVCFTRSGFPVIRQEDGMYRGGCRGPWTEEEVRDHFGSDYYDQETAKNVLAALDGKDYEFFPKEMWDVQFRGSKIPEGMRLPERVRYVFFGGSDIPEGMTLPEGVKYVFFGGSKIPEGMILPEGLKEVHFGGSKIPEGMKIPENTEVYH